MEGLLIRHFPKAEVSAVESYGEACDVVVKRPTDLVLTDMLCCSAEDLRRLPELVEAVSPGRVVVFGNCSDRVTARRAQAAGIHGYVPATSRAELVGAAIGLVLAGGVYFPPLAPADARPAEDGRPGLLERLSPRQREVLQGIQAGQSNKAIARALAISVATVKLHVQAILRLTGARNRTEAVAIFAGRADETGAVTASEGTP